MAAKEKQPKQKPQVRPKPGPEAERHKFVGGPLAAFDELAMYEPLRNEERLAA